MSVLLVAGLRPALMSGQGALRSAGAKADRCAACHTAESLTAPAGKYFEHYKTVHREAQRRNLACGVCHAPLAREIRGAVSRGACASCHEVGKSARRIEAGAAHSIHLSRPGVVCASCHKDAAHRIDMLQLFDACGNCH
ncbi:MAG: cytochrome c3 family protein [Blastocatellia bacterium]